MKDIQAEIEGLQEELTREPASRLIKYLKRKGPYKGEFVDLTPAQYHELMSRRPKDAIINKKTGRIPWEYALDEVATELGYPSDEALKNAVERSLKTRHKLDQLEAEVRSRKKPKGHKVEAGAMVKIETTCPPGIQIATRCKSKSRDVNGTEVTAVRQPAYWRVHVTKEDQELDETNMAGVVRYAAEADKSLKQIAAGLAEQHGREVGAGLRRGKILEPSGRIRRFPKRGVLLKGG